MNPTITSKGTIRPFAQKPVRWIALFALLGLVVLVASFIYLRSAPTTMPTVSAFTAEDHSYDDIEHVRATRNQTIELNGVADHSYDDIERVRSTRSQTIELNGVADHSYDDIERIRSTR
jgi:hypothetical protein